MSQTIKDISAGSLEDLVDRVSEAREYSLALSPEDYQLIIDALSTLSILQVKMADKDITLHKLKNTQTKNLKLRHKKSAKQRMMRRRKSMRKIVPIRNGRKGKFNKVEPAQLFRITGNSPFVPTMHLSEKVRCSLGVSITASTIFDQCEYHC